MEQQQQRVLPLKLFALAGAAGLSLASLLYHSRGISLARDTGPREEKKDFTPPFVGALDQGTSSTRFIVFDSRTQLVASCQKELPPLYPQTG